MSEIKKDHPVIADLKSAYDLINKASFQFNEILEENKLTMVKKDTKLWRLFCNLSNNAENNCGTAMIALNNLIVDLKHMLRILEKESGENQK